jgi:hypothetical protein
VTVASALLLGFVLGLKHAVDADHLAAVATIVSERSSLLRSSLIGASWGLGHSLALVPMALAVVLLRVEIGPQLARMLEIGVALMLIGLALDSLRKLARGDTLHVHAHRHAEQRHVHPYFHAAGADAVRGTPPHDDGGHGLSLKPVLVGLVHGLAGSAALMLLVLSTIPERSLALLYVALFAAGSTLGMVATSLALGVPMRFTARRFARANLALRALAGCFSLVVGASMLYQLALRGA